MNFLITCQVQADSAGRALSAIVIKMIKNGGFPFRVNSILHDACIISISDYGGEFFWDFRAVIGIKKPGILSEVVWP